MTDRVNDTEAHVAAMRTMVRWVQTEGGLKKKQKNAKLDAIAEHVGISRDQLNKFLGQKLNDDDARKIHVRLAQGLRAAIIEKNTIPQHIADIAEDIYGEAVTGVDAQAIQTPRVLRYKALSDAEPRGEKDLATLTGLNLVIRRSTESLPAPTKDNPEAEIKGWAVALLNVIPRHYQDGNHHPLFKMRQVSLSRNELVVEGVIVAHNDRIVLEGVELTEKKLLSATIAASADDWDRYRAAKKQDRRFTKGIMIGLSNAKAPFAAPFICVSVPNSVLPKNPSPAQEADFNDIHLRARKSLGVRDLKETVEAVQHLGVSLEPGHLEDLRDQAMNAQTFKLF